MRINKTDYYMDVAKAVSARSTCLRRQYGAVIVNNDEIVSTGYNGSVRGEVNCCDIGFCRRTQEAHNRGDYSNCKSVHAEQNAIISASRKDMLGSILYLYGEENGVPLVEAEPCPICRRMMKNAGITKYINLEGVCEL